MSGTQDNRFVESKDDGQVKASSGNGEHREPSGNLIQYRPLIISDKNFVYSTWLKGLYYGNDWFREIDKEIYFAYYSKLIQYILSKPTVYVNAACLRDDIEVILGYAVLEVDTDQNQILHWVFTKASWRNIGIATNLIPPNVRTVTHLTKVGKSLKPKEWRFNPFFK